MATKKKSSRKRSAVQPQPSAPQLPQSTQSQPETTAALAVIPRNQQIQIGKAFDFTERQIQLITSQVAPGLQKDELEVFLHVCKARRLDPLQKQVYAIKRMTTVKEKRELPNGNWVTNERKEERMTIQVGIDGFRAIANRTNTYAPSERRTEYVYKDAEKKTLLLSCVFWVKKYAQGQWHEFSGEAFFSEYNAGTTMWTNKPHNQLEKCAEAKALRRGWPEELGQLYVAEEFESQDHPAGTKNAEQRQTQTQREVGTLKASEQPNRGHGDENLASAHKKDGKIIDAEYVDQNPETTEQPKTAEQVASSVPGTKIAADEHSNKTSKRKTGKSVPVDVMAAQKKTRDREFIVVKTKAIEDGALFTFFCWHKSLFDTLLAKPKKCVFEISQKEGEDYVNIDSIMYLDGKEFTPPDTTKATMSAAASASSPSKDEVFNNGR